MQSPPTEPHGPGPSLQSLLEPLTGNEFKLLIVIVDMFETKVPTTVNALAAAARIDRTTVMRLIPSLSDKGYLQLVPTEKALRLTTHVRRILAGPEVTIMLRTSGDEAVALSDHRGGVNPSQNPTDTVAESDQPRSASQRVNLGGNNKPGVNLREGFATASQRMALDFAKLSAEALGDGNYLGMHRLAWQTALTADAANGNNNLEQQLIQLVYRLQERHKATGQHQGRAFSACAKTLLAKAGCPIRT